MTKRVRVLAVASGGGHWIQLYRLRPAWDDCTVTYVTTDAGYANEVRLDAAERGQNLPDFFTVVEANRWQRMALVRLLASLAVIIVRVRPHVIVTTGAAAGYFAIRIGGLLRARTAWIDSMANAEELSLSGRQAGAHVDLWLTQWDELARPGGPEYRGSVL